MESERFNELLEDVKVDYYDWFEMDGYEINEMKEYIADLDGLREYLWLEYGIECTIEDLYNLWSWHSNDWSAGWLIIGEDYESCSQFIFAMLEVYSKLDSRTHF